MPEYDAGRMTQPADSCYEALMGERPYANEHAQPGARKLNFAAAFFAPREASTTPSALQPGLLATFRVFLLVTALTPALAWHMLETRLGVRGATFKVMSETIFTIVLLVYTSWPWWRRKMGRAFFPLALLVKSAQPVVGDYLTLIWFVPLSSREYFTLLSVLRNAIQFQFLVIFIAWQYDLVWPIITAVVFSALNAVFGFLFVKPGGTFFPLYVICITTQLGTAGGTGLAMGIMRRSQRRQAAALNDRNRKLAQYASVVEQLAVIQERNRLARELHDTLAHSLSAVAVQIEATQALMETDVRAGQKLLARALDTTRQGLTEARRSLRALRASPLEDLGLSLAVRDLAESVASRAGLKLDLEIGSHMELAPEVEQCLYRVAQEALTNVARHANASSVRVVLMQEDNHVHLVVRDDGRGFDIDAAADRCYGLHGLRERAEAIGATLVVESEEGQGTGISLGVLASIKGTP